MLDWNEYRNQILARVGEIGKLTPDTVKGYMALGGAGARTGHLDGKTRELIALAVAISLRCDGCITVHTAAAKKLGATKAEIAGALGVGIRVNAGAPPRLLNPHARRVRCGGVIRQDLPGFRLLHSHQRALSDTSLPSGEADSFAKGLAPRCSPSLVLPTPGSPAAGPFLPEDRPSPLKG
jgi:AhpD family alkylhydroperoxidase